MFQRQHLSRATEFFGCLSKPGHVSGGLGPAESGSSLLTALTSRLRVQDQTSAISRIYQGTPDLIRGPQLGVQLVPRCRQPDP